jgi:hypothetical protein
MRESPHYPPEAEEDRRAVAAEAGALVAILPAFAKATEDRSSFLRALCWPAESQ